MQALQLAIKLLGRMLLRLNEQSGGHLGGKAMKTVTWAFQSRLGINLAVGGEERYKKAHFSVTAQPGVPAGIL